MTRAPDLVPLGLDAVLIRFASTYGAAANTAAQALAAALQARPLAGQTEAAPGLASVLLRFDRTQISRDAVMAQVHDRLCQPAPPPPAPRHWTVPACFGGRSGFQLAEVAARIGRPETAVVTELCATDLRVLALGFAPGQPYLGPLPAHWQMPRLPALTPRVPAGTITTALGQIVLFAAPSPTGWRALGRSALRPFAPDSPRPFLLHPGDLIRFCVASEAEVTALEATGDPLGGAVRCFPK